MLTGLALITAWLGAVFIFASLISKRWPQQQELSRKVVHIGAGFALPIAWATEIPVSLALAAAALASSLALINHRWRLLASIEDVGRFSYGTVAYGASITILLAFFWPQRADLVCAAVLTMALADGLAGLLGANFSSHRWQIFGQTKSIIGTATMALVTLLVLALLLPNLPWHVVIAIATSATLLEQFSWAGLDNLTVPLLVGLMGAWLRG
ncbi:MAG: dolichol kinase [Synechococcus sp. SupBloom_Metag_053]|nr:dolichol kinase [Synechococcus sp. SupBloom_Metag_053]